MKKYYLIFVLLLLFVFTVSNGYGQFGTAAEYILTNVASFTAGNVPSPAVDSDITVTVATMYGGRLSVSPSPTVTAYMPIIFPGVTSFTLTVTNYGNAEADFGVRIIDTNANLRGGDFRWSLQNTGDIQDIVAGGDGTFQLFITNTVAATNGAWYSLLVQVTNQTAPSGQEGYYAYAPGIGTNWYGGDQGIRTNHTITNAGSLIYLQHSAQAAPSTNQAGFLSVIVQGPVLVISKSVLSVSHPSLLYGARTDVAEPGAEIIYNIFVSNSGVSYATNLTIVDAIDTTYLEFVRVTNGVIFSNTTALPAGNTLTFKTYGAENDKLAVNGYDNIQIVVRVR